MLIKNGMVHDAVNRDAYKADIRIKGGKITEIGKDLSTENSISLLIEMNKNLKW